MKLILFDLVYTYMYECMCNIIICERYNVPISRCWDSHRNIHISLFCMSCMLFKYVHVYVLQYTHTHVCINILYIIYEQKTFIYR